MQHVYRELAPAPALRRYVECYWRATSAGAPDFRPREPLVPDLRVELIFNAGVPWRWFESERSQPSAALTCIGMRGSSLAIQQPGRLDHFAIRFRPAGLAAFVRVPLGELTQRCWDMCELWGSDARELEQRLADAHADATRVAAADEFLLRRLNQRACELGASAARQLSASHGRMSIEQLAADHGVSYKRLERSFARDVGLSPKHFARVARVQRALELAALQPSAALARLAVDSGYADQAHFSREFTRLIGVAPRAFFAARFAVFETLATSGSVAIRPEAAGPSKTFKTLEPDRSMQRP